MSVERSAQRARAIRPRGAHDVEVSARNAPLGGFGSEFVGEVADPLAEEFREGRGAAGVRLARLHTGRDRVLGCGYHGWLDWCSRGEGIPQAVTDLYGEVPFNDAERTRAGIRAAGDRLAAVVVEPVVEAAPSADWLVPTVS